MAKRERKKKYATVFLSGKQKRVLRPLSIEGLTVEEFIARNADSIWLSQNEMWEFIVQYEQAPRMRNDGLDRKSSGIWHEIQNDCSNKNVQDDDIPF